MPEEADFQFFHSFPLPRWEEGDRNLSTVSRDKECRHYILQFSLAPALEPGCGLAIEYTHPLLFTVAADFGDIHGMAEYGEGMKLTGNLGSQLVTDLPQPFRQLVNE